MQAGHFLMSAA